MIYFLVILIALALGYSAGCQHTRKKIKNEQLDIMNGTYIKESFFKKACNKILSLF